MTGTTATFESISPANSATDTNPVSKKKRKPAKKTAAPAEFGWFETTIARVAPGLYGRVVDGREAVRGVRKDARKQPSAQKKTPQAPQTPKSTEPQSSAEKPYDRKEVFLAWYRGIANYDERVKTGTLPDWYAGAEEASFKTFNDFLDALRVHYNYLDSAEKIPVNHPDYNSAQKVIEESEKLLKEHEQALFDVLGANNEANQKTVSSFVDAVCDKEIADEEKVLKGEQTKEEKKTKKLSLSSFVPSFFSRHTKKANTTNGKPEKADKKAEKAEKPAQKTSQPNNKKTTNFVTMKPLSTSSKVTFGAFVAAAAAATHYVLAMPALSTATVAGSGLVLLLLANHMDKQRMAMLVGKTGKQAPTKKTPAPTPKDKKPTGSAGLFKRTVAGIIVIGLGLTTIFAGYNLVNRSTPVPTPKPKAEVTQQVNQGAKAPTGGVGGTGIGASKADTKAGTGATAPAPSTDTKTRSVGSWTAFDHQGAIQAKAAMGEQSWAMRGKTTTTKTSAQRLDPTTGKMAAADKAVVDAAAAKAAAVDGKGPGKANAKVSTTPANTQAQKPAAAATKDGKATTASTAATAAMPADKKADVNTIKTGEKVKVYLKDPKTDKYEGNPTLTAALAKQLRAKGQAEESGAARLAEIAAENAALDAIDAHFAAKAERNGPHRPGQIHVDGWGPNGWGYEQPMAKALKTSTSLDDEAGWNHSEETGNRTTPKGDYGKGWTGLYNWAKGKGPSNG